MPETTTPAKKAAAKRTTDTPAWEHPNLATALAAFQADMPTVHKGQTARIPGRDGRAGYSYQYADLADVAKVAHPLLARHGLSFVTKPRHLEGVGFVLQGTLRHATEGEDVGILPITGRSAQELGSSLTYLRRYLLGCMTGIVTDDDEDGGLAQEAGSERPQATTYAPPPEDQPQVRQAPQAQAPQPAEHQKALMARIDSLPPALQANVREWWNGQGLPSVWDVDEYQAAAVHSYITEQTGQGAQDPH